MRKVATHDLTIQSSQLQVFEKKQRKENCVRKEGIHDLTIQSSVLQVFE